VQQQVHQQQEQRRQERQQADQPSTASSVPSDQDVESICQAFQRLSANPQLQAAPIYLPSSECSFKY
jgi:hypothetical protein